MEIRLKMEEYDACKILWSPEALWLPPSLPLTTYFTP